MRYIIKECFSTDAIAFVPVSTLGTHKKKYYKTEGNDDGIDLKKLGEIVEKNPGVKKIGVKGENDKEIEINAEDPKNLKIVGDDKDDEKE
jgi:hypothetical protein